MPYNSETETFYQAPATVVDSTPDGDTVQEGFDDRLTPAMAGLYADLNLLKADGMISVGIPATTTARGIGRVATSDDLVDGATITNGPAFLAAGVNTSVTAAAGKIPVTDADGSVNNLCGARYATCATAAATAAKAADLANFQLVKGARVFVTFSNANTVAGAITLNVNGTGAKSIYNELGAVSATNPATFPAGVPIEFIYDGTNWTYRKYQDEFAKVVGGAPMYAARAWVNFDGTATPITIRASGNISSITDNGVGDYTINLTTSMVDTGYAVVAEGSDSYYSVQFRPFGYYSGGMQASAPTANSFRIGAMVQGAANAIDPKNVMIAVYR